MNKVMDGTYFGPDSEIKEFPKCVEARKTCGLAAWCGTCMYRVQACMDYGLDAPMRCRRESSARS